MITVVSWNMDGGNRHGRDQMWRVLQETGADVALLQDAAEPLPGIADGVALGPTSWDDPVRQRPPMVVKLSDRVEVEWFTPVTAETSEIGAAEIAVSDRRTIAAARVTPADSAPFIAVSMYARNVRKHPLARGSISVYPDASMHRIVSDLSAFTASLDRSGSRHVGHRVLAAGDMNTLYGLTSGGGREGARRNRIIWDRMAALDLEFLGPQYPNGRLSAESPKGVPANTRNVPTHYDRDGAASGVNVKTPLDAQRQLDYVFASRGFHESIRTCALNGVEEWGPSDHCRILIVIDE